MNVYSSEYRATTWYFMALASRAVIITGTMKSFAYHTSLLLMLCVLSSCSLPGYPTADEPVKEILSHDTLSSVRVPLAWVQLAVHERAVIQAADLEQQHYLVVLTENKFGFWQFLDLDLEGFFRMKSWYLIDTLSDVSLGQPRECTIHGNQAIMLEISGATNSERISYLYTAVEGFHHYHEIILWAPTDRYERAKPVFLMIVQSFEEQH